MLRNWGRHSKLLAAGTTIGLLGALVGCSADAGTDGGDAEGTNSPEMTASEDAVTLDQSTDESVIRTVLALAAVGDPTACDGVYDLNGSSKNPLVYMPDDYQAHTDCSAIVTMFAQQYGSHASEFPTLELEARDADYLFDIGDQRFRFFVTEHGSDGLRYVDIESFGEMVGYDFP